MENIWLYLSMPLICAAVGYGTNWLCIKMMCYPIEFMGFKEPWLGWQGIVPRRAEHIAGGQIDLIMARLIDMHELFAQIDAHDLIRELDPILIEMVEEITDEIMLLQAPRLWESLPLAIKQRVYDKVRKEAPAVTKRFLEDFQGNLEEIVDLKALIKSTFVSDPALLVRFFEKIGHKEFAFVQNSGLWFGLLFGLGQMGLWMGWQNPWILPLAGVFVGYATNWLALNMIFSPKNPITLGPWVIQGLFLKRQDEVAVDLGRTVAQEILNPTNIVDSMIRGPAADRFLDLVQRAVKRGMDDYAGFNKPFVTLTVGTQSYLEIRDRVAMRIINRIPQTMRLIAPYTEKALDIDGVIRTNMKKLTPEEFEGLLRPIFQEDEWKLLVLGGVIGFLVGWFQLVFMFGQSLFR